MLKKKAKIITSSQLKLITIIGIQCSILIGFILFRLTVPSFERQPEIYIYPFCCSLLGLAIWSFFSWYLLTKSLFNPYSFFLLSAYIFNSGQALLEVFGLTKNELLEFFEFSFSSQTILDTLYLVFIAMGTFHLGGLLSLINIKHKKSKNLNPEQNILIEKNTYKVGITLLKICFLPAVFVIFNSVRTVLTSGYMALYEGGGTASAAGILADFIIPACLFLLAGSKNVPKGRVISATIVILYAMSKFLSGERNRAIMPLISFAWLWNYFISPFPKTLFLGVGSLIGFVLIPVISATRTEAGGDKFSINYLIEIFSQVENPLFAAIEEMGSSMMTVAQTIELVPRVRDFQWGLDYFYAILTLVPSIFGDVHPTIARGLAEKWLVEEINPYFAFNYGTYGFSFIAEAFLSFGWIGAPIALGVIGFLFAKMTLWAMKSHNPAKLAMLTSFLSFFLFYARSESALMMRSLVWYSLFPYLWVCILSRTKRKKITI
ncbi:MAG: O-antigen polysaccharide polymerase Wzy [Nostocaceae cyanobacterium]|nr:O-antigen polysaccharide polymerase Wzy [Nostocaceae cyanobacterium]